ncbi:MAG: nucleotidyltransferase domain-containing protein [Anaerolineae bacterium]|nr:nucleotidyltransferase domain-containing protein [Anaerolineae bacterium]
MVESAITRVVQNYLRAVREAGISARFAILFGSYGRGDARPDSDIDLLVVAPEFDGPYDRRQVDLLWALRTSTDSRIEPVAVGERRWRDDDASPLLEVARREGQTITPATG